ncbi:type I polyketide synthase [Rhizohabitans arisaemae]|uniref:type I polyketide synthase n=1 Tax=Rhizohabitans arisaemae TaxID=2720610 RepID=UPI0024B088D5|nr:beta-ketoacyl synthase N-terminal-like domain-containing protein [Rhizohabitans arisaemae]
MRDAIAIVGIACRFPGAADKDDLWRMLLDGEEAAGPVPDSRWQADRLHSASGEPGTANTVTAALLPDLDVFDNAFFRIGADDAAAMDPQQRLLLPCAWHAVEDAGIDPASLAGSRTGVYIGVMGTDWLWDAASSPDPRAFTVKHGAGLGHHMAANRLSYHLDLRGPSVAVDTACSSSLVAVHQACSALILDECDQALAGGVNAVLTPVNNVYFTLLGISAPDGRCKPFSSLADGLARGEGVGVVVLRRLDDALAAGQRIYAVIRGGAVSHNGRSNGLTAPARWGQQEAIRAAYRRAGVKPADVSFVEAHGTGTRFGDMIEVRALGAFHGGRGDDLCALGSIKGNLGHLEGAAGVASLIKAALALHHRTIPPSRNSAPENPELQLRANGLRLVTERLALPAGPVVGSVSAFGVSGTNAHLVLEGVEAEEPDTRPGIGVFTLSAPDPESLRRNLARQADHVAARPAGELAGLCRTSNRVKSSLRLRFAVPARSHRGLVRSLRDAARDRTLPDDLVGSGRGPVKIGLFLGGAGDWADGRVIGVGEGPEPFRRHLEEAEDALCRRLDDSGACCGTAEGSGPGGEAAFCVGYAFGRTLLDLGLEPVFVAGHGVGRIAADCLAGAIPLADAARLVIGLPRHGERVVPRIPILEPEESQGPAPTHLVLLGNPGGIAERFPGARPLPARVAEAGEDLLEVVAALYRDGARPLWEELYRQGPVPPPLGLYSFADTRFPVRTSPRRPW